MSAWNDTIFGNATQYYSLPPVVYHMDGDSGILDNSREIKMRIKAFAYAYRMSNDTKWVDRAWSEIQVCSEFIVYGLCKYLGHSPDRMLLAMAPHLSVPTTTSGIRLTSSTQRR
jgi:hypothetical protein